MKAVWSGSISFGLVNIPVKLYSAIEGDALNFDMLDKHDLSRIRYKRINEDTGKEVSWSDIVKGYQLDGKYIVLTEKDFENASAEKTKLIEIEEFINEDDIDSILYESSYYIEPVKGGAKPYILLMKALQKSKKAGLGTFVLRNRENLGLIKVMGDVLLLSKIHFPEEIRETKEINVSQKIQIKQAELKMATVLIDQMTGTFNIHKYKDTYSDQLLKLIKAKAKGSKTKPHKLKIMHTKSDDVMAQLKRSIKEKQKKAS